MIASSLRVLTGAALFSFAAGASATLTVNLDTEFSGGADPSGTAPWLRAAFTTSGNDVSLTLSSLLQDSREFVTEWGFNLNPALDPTQLTFSFQSQTGTWSEPDLVISTGVNAFKADGDGFFDIQFLFDNAPPSDRFNESDTGTWLISYAGGALSEGDFLFNSAPGGGNGTWTSAAHVQGIGGSLSGWIGGDNDGPDDPGSVPEPGSLALLGLGLAGLSLLRRRRA